MKLQKLLVIALVSMFLLSIGAAIPARAYPDTNACIDPPAITWDTSGHVVGDTFHAYLKIGNFTNLAGYEYKIAWNRAVLTCIRVVDTIPLGPGPFIATNLTENAYNATHGRMWFVVTGMAGGQNVGAATLRDMTFQVIAGPPHILGGFVDSPITLYDTLFGDALANPIAHTAYSGYFLFNYVPPPPPSIQSGSKTMSALGTFFLPVSVVGADPVYAVTSVHFELHYNPALLNALSATAGPFLGGAIIGFVLAPGVITVDVSGAAGSGTGVVAIILFDAIYGEAGNILTCALDLQNSNFNLGSAFTAEIDGLYTIAIPSPALKAIGVEPLVYNALDEGEVFTLDVFVYNITSVDRLFGVQFTMSYDPALLELIAVTEGPFLSLFPWQIPPTYFFVYPHAGYFTVATGLIGGGSEPPGYIYPNGQGSVARVTFKATVGIPGETVGCPLHLYDVIFGDVDALEIPVGIIHDGQYYLTMDKRYIDIFTQYPDPYGGQKRMHDADAYGPQHLVIMYAFVTYNRWPVQNKLVEFEIHGPVNPIYNIVLYRTAFTNSTGYATISFRIDWPCEYPETIAFGIWTVYGAVELDQIKVVDILHFEAGWLVKLIKITTNEDAYRHGWHMTIDVDYVSISHQIRPVFFTMTIYDDAGYGLGSLTFSTSVGYGPGTVEVTCFMIQKWARAGIGTVYADAYTAQPSQCGVPYCPEISKTFTILAL